MLTCRETSRLISDNLDRSLSWFERVCLRVHLLGCGPCRRFRQTVGWLHHALAAPPGEDALPADARERIQRIVDQAIGEE